MAPTSGLFSQDFQSIPLTGVAVHAVGQGPALKVTVAHHYRNDEPQAVEAVYSFPLPEEAAVCGFEVELGGQTLKGGIADREKSLEEYDEALGRGVAAYLLDQDRPNVFTAYVGNLKPQEEVLVRISYVAVLTWLPDGFQLIIPMVVSPRYFTAQQIRTLDPAELLHLTPPAVQGPLPYGFILTLDLELPGPLAGVECPSHPFSWEINGTRLKGALAGQAAMDQDFVLNLKLEQRHQPFCCRARAVDGSSVVLLGFHPDLPAGLPRDPLEVIFLVDCSGSMAGESAAQARNALELCLRALEATDRFNIVAFGSEYHRLFRTSRPFNQANLEEASRFVATLRGHLGGTEIYPPLKACLDQVLPKGHTRKIILLTDGEVANEADLITLVRHRPLHGAIYPVGLGRGPNAHLIRSLARASGGAAEFVHPQARLEPVMVRLMEKVASPAFHPVSIDWDGLTPELQSPRALPPLHVGERLWALARFDGQAPQRVTVRLELPGGDPLVRPLEPVRFTGEAAQVLPLMLAREFLRELEDEYQSGPAAGNRKAYQALRRRILEISKNFGILSSLTSFLVAPERPGAEPSEVVMRRVPVVLTRGWGGLESAYFPLQPGAPPHPSSYILEDAYPSWRYGFRKKALLRRDRVERLCLEFEIVTPPPLDPQEQDFRRLIQEQHAEGWWPLSAWLADQVQTDLETLVTLAQKLPLLPPTASQAVATLSALYLLHTRFADRHDQWRLSAAKAERCLISYHITVPPPAPDFLPWLQKTLSGVFSSRPQK